MRMAASCTKLRPHTQNKNLKTESNLQRFVYDTLLMLTYRGLCMRMKQLCVKAAHALNCEVMCVPSAPAATKMETRRFGRSTWSLIPRNIPPKLMKESRFALACAALQRRAC